MLKIHESRSTGDARSIQNIRKLDVVGDKPAMLVPYSLIAGAEDAQRNHAWIRCKSRGMGVGVLAGSPHIKSALASEGTNTNSGQQKPSAEANLGHKAFSEKG